MAWGGASTPSSRRPGGSARLGLAAGLALAEHERVVPSWRLALGLAKQRQVRVRRLACFVRFELRSWRSSFFCINVRAISNPRAYADAAALCRCKQVSALPTCPGLGPVRLPSRRLLGVGQGGVIVAELRMCRRPVREQFRRPQSAPCPGSVPNPACIGVRLHPSSSLCTPHSQVLSRRAGGASSASCFGYAFLSLCVGAQSGTIGYT